MNKHRIQSENTKNQPTNSQDPIQEKWKGEYPKDTQDFNNEIGYRASGYSSVHNQPNNWGHDEEQGERGSSSSQTNKEENWDGESSNRRTSLGFEQHTDLQSEERGKRNNKRQERPLDDLGKPQGYQSKGGKSSSNWEV